LPDAALLAMFRNDELECTYLHLYSLRHFGDMIERIATRGAVSEVAAEPIEISKEASRHPPRTAGRNAKAEEASA
jgi:hypothetical protein